MVALALTVTELFNKVCEKVEKERKTERKKERKKERTETPGIKQKWGAGGGGQRGQLPPNFLSQWDG